jgi:lipopolysaccharide biosynthesis glycosyltransferase
MAFDGNYAPYAGNPVRSIQHYHPDAGIFAVVTSDVTERLPGVKYYVYDPEFRCNIRNGITGKVFPPVVYNFIKAVDLVECDRAILMPVDCVLCNPADELFNSGVGASGLACIKMNRKSNSYNMQKMMSNWSNGFNIKRSLYHHPSFNTGGMVFDFRVMRAQGGFEKLHKLMMDYGMSEMAALCIYAEDKWEQLPDRFCARNEWIDNTEDVIILDYAGANKPWNTKHKPKHRGEWDRWTK